MAALAYHCDPYRKRQVVQRLHALQQVGIWVARPIHWNGEAGSLVGSLLQGEDLDEWERRFGLPKWLALVLDGMLANAPDVKRGVACGIELLESISVGARLSGVGSHCVLELLEGDRCGLTTLRQVGPLASTLHQVAALHRDLLNGHEIAPVQWRRVRAAAVSLTDTLDENSLEARIGTCIEAAAWDAASSRTLVSDVLRTWIWAMSASAEQSSGWGPADDERIKTLLASLHAQAKVEATDPNAHIDVFKLLERVYPDDAARLRANIAGQHERRAAQWQRAADVLRGAFAVDLVPLIPRAHLFANPARAAISISPDGQWLAWLANDSGVMNIWAAPRDQPEDARQLTFDRHRGIGGFSWVYLPGLLLYSQDRDGDENWRLFGVEVASARVRELVAVKPGVRVGIHSTSRMRREELLVTLNQRDPRYPDLYLLDLESGALTLHELNPGLGGYLVDDAYNVRLAWRSTAAGGSDILRRDEHGQWQPWIALSADDARSSGPTHFSADGRTLYFRDSRGRDTAALVAIDVDSGALTVLAEDSRADIGSMIVDRRDYRPLAYAVSHERYRLHLCDDTIRADVDFLDAEGIGEWNLGSRTEDDTVWLVAASSDLHPGSAYLYDRQARTLGKLFDVRPQLADAPLAPMHSTVIRARDGLELVSYLSVPVDADAGDLRTHRPVPLVLLVHGGPWSRDGFGYNAMHQWLANRGYAVLSVNFRGSTGFGKTFLDAGNGEWGRKMDEDLEDAVQWAIERGIADPAKLAIFGGSYGGYAVLSALTRYPDRYACGIDVVGPSNLETLLASIPPYWEAARAMQYRAIGNPDTAEGLALLRERSPLHRAAAIRAPLLIAQGANDPRVKQAESEQMVQALRANGIAVDYALYADEGHGFVREPNRMSFYAQVEAFLARHLGGRQEPAPAGGFPGSTLQLQSGRPE